MEDVPRCARLESLEILGEILHPELFPVALENTSWERLSTTATRTIPH
jgi:hypothetical protein